MGVYIKNMEMPTGNDELRLIIHSNGQVIISHQTYYEEAEAVPVPLHGDLIDRDALIEKVIAKYLEHERKGEFVFAAAEIKQDIVDLISNAPTVIVAEEGE